MADIQGPTPNSEKAESECTYINDYRNGVDLFQKSLIQAEESKYGPQKEQFHDVMRESMEVLNQAARQMKHQGLLQQNEKISEDFQAYEKDPSKANEATLREDLEDAKNAVRD